MLAHLSVRLAVMFDPAHRVLLHALLFSLLAHLLLLVEMAPLSKAAHEAPAGALRAVLRASPSTPAVEATPREPAAPPRAEPPAVPRRSPALPERLPGQAHTYAVSRPGEFAVPQAAPTSAAAGLRAEAPAATGEAAGEKGLPASPALPEGGGAPAPGAGVPPDELREYRLALAVQARRFRRYPAVARERGQEGTVEVAISVKAGLPAPQVGVSASSGHAALDAQAQEMMRQAALAAPLPGGLRGRDFRLVVPVLFSLDEAP